jgi:hypothetical protein
MAYGTRSVVGHWRNTYEVSNISRAKTTRDLTLLNYLV